MRQSLATLSIIALAFTLTACSSMNNSFDCPNKAGVSCKSLDQINGMVDAGQIEGNGEKVSNVVSTRSPDFEAFPMTTSYADGHPVRYGETVQRIWMAPYEDTEGNYHQDSVIYAVVKGGHWIGSPVKSINAQ